MKLRIISVLLTIIVLLSACSSNSEEIADASLIIDKETEEADDESLSSKSLSEDQGKKTNFSYEDLLLVPENYSGSSSDSIVEYSKILLESGGAGLDEGIKNGSAYFKDDYSDFLSAFSITQNYMNSPFYNVQVTVDSVTKLEDSIFYDEYNDLYTAVYLMEIVIPDDAEGLLPGKQNWYLKTAIRAYDPCLLVDWFMPEEEYLSWKDVQAYPEDCEKIYNYFIGLTYGNGFQNINYATPLDIPEVHRGTYLILIDPNGTVGSSQETMNALSEDIFGIDPFVPHPESHLKQSERGYELTDGGGYPIMPNYINKREVIENTTWYYYYYYVSGIDYSFRGFVQKSSRITKFGIRNNRIEAYILNDEVGSRYEDVKIDISQSTEFNVLEGERNTAIKKVDGFQYLTNSQVVGIKNYLFDHVSWRDIKEITNLEIHPMEGNMYGTMSRTALIVPQFVGSDVWIEYGKYIDGEYQTTNIIQTFKNTPQDFALLYSSNQVHLFPELRIVTSYNGVESYMDFGEDGKGSAIYSHKDSLVVANLGKELTDFPNLPVTKSTLSIPALNKDSELVVPNDTVEVEFVSPFTEGFDLAKNPFRERLFFNTLPVNISAYQMPTD